MYQLPEGFKEYSRDGDSVTFIRPGHTVSEPRLLIINRKTPVANGNGFSIPQYRVRTVDGHVDSDGKPVRDRSAVDIYIRKPVDASLEPIQTSLAAIATMLADVDFQDDALVDYMFPKEGDTPA